MRSRLAGDRVVNSQAGHPGMETLPSVIRRLSARRNRTACIQFRETSRADVSVGALFDESARLSGRLRSAGVAPGETVVVLADPGPCWVAACLAITAIGGIIVPVDAQHTDETLRHILADSQTRFIFTQGANLPALRRLDLGSEMAIELVDREDPAEKSAASKSEFPSVSPSAEETAVIFYTSGTTGPPKGVPISHQNLLFEVNMVEQTGLIGDSDRMLLPLPLHHVYPFVVGMVTPLALGVPIIFPRAVTGPEVLRALREGEATIVLGVPRLYRVLFSGIQERFRSLGPVAQRLFNGNLALSRGIRNRTGLYAGKWLFRPLHRQMGPRLRIVASGGAALDSELAANLEALGWQVAIGYGLTETTSIATLHRPGEAGLNDVGKAAPGVAIRIDPAGWPKGRAREGHYEKGEVLIKGPNVFRGYHRLPRTAPDSFTEDGWFCTGDLGYLDEAGHLHLLGRASTLIVTESGENIQPQQIEAVYARHSFIAEAGVLERSGRVVGILVPNADEVAKAGLDTDAAIRQAVETVSAGLPTVQSMTDYVVSRSPLPRTRLGKIRRHLLAGLYEDARSKRSAAREDLSSGGEDMRPEDRDLLQTGPAGGIWEYLRRRYSDRPLTLESSPQLDLGIDSLGWLDLTFEISRRGGVALDEAAIGRIRTVRDLLRESVTGGKREGTLGDGFLLNTPEAHLSEAQKRWLEPMAGRRAKEAYGLYLLNRILMRRLFRLESLGLHRLPSPPFVLTPNHLSYLDAPTIAAALDFATLRQTYWAGWTGAAFANVVMRHISRVFQVVPIEPKKGFLSSLAFGAAVLKRQGNLIWFPEGGRSRSGRLNVFKPGIGRLLYHFQVPVVPVIIRGSYEAMPRGRFLQSFHPIRIEFGAPLDVAQLAVAGTGAESHERIIHALRNHVQGMLEDGEVR